MEIPPPLTPSDYKTTATIPKDISVNDRIAIFFDGAQWNVIRIDILLRYPAIHFIYHSSSSENNYINTIIFSPYSMQVMIFRNKVRIISIDLNNRSRMTLRHIDMDKGSHPIHFTLDRPFDINEQGFHPMILRRPIILTTLRHLYSEGSGRMNDCQFIVLKKRIASEGKYMINPIYLDNTLDYLMSNIVSRYHPKTLVTMIQYYSEKKQRMKYILLVNRDIEPTIATGWNRISSGVVDYLNRNKEMINKKKAFFFPIFWYCVDHLYPVKKIIYL